jgi:hypothetical protein
LWWANQNGLLPKKEKEKEKNRSWTWEAPPPI